MTGTVQNVWHASGIYTRESLLGVINGLPLAIVVVDENRKVALANKAACEFADGHEVQLIGQVGGEAFGCIHHNDVPEGCGFGPNCLKCRMRSTLLDTINKKQPHYMVDTTMVLKNHGKRYLRISTLPMVLNTEGAVLVAIEDNTKAKAYEETALEKERLSAAVQTAGAVCHEMNQPLFVIMGFAEMLLDEVPDDGELRTNLQEIKTQADRLGEISQKLMRITRYKTKKYLRSKIVDIDASSG